MVGYGFLIVALLLFLAAAKLAMDVQLYAWACLAVAIIIGALGTTMREQNGPHDSA